MTTPIHAPKGRILVTLLALLVAIGVIPLLWTSYTLSRRSREILEFDQKASQLDKVRGLSQQIALYMGGLRAQVSSIARAAELDAGRFDDRIDRLKESRGLEGYIGADAHFYSVNVLNVSCVGAGAGIQLPDPEVQQLLHQGCLVARQGEALASPPIFAESVKEPVMVFAEPIRTGGAVQGAVLAVANLTPVLDMTRNMATGGTVDVYVVDDRGRLVAHSDAHSLGDRRDVSQLEIVKQFMASRGRASSTVPFTMTTPEGAELRMLGTFSRVPDDSAWGVIAQVSEDRAYYDANTMWQRSKLLVASVAALAVALGTMFARRISLPIQDLARGARKLAGGEYSTRVTVKARNEIGVLAGAFNHMGAEIEKAIEEIRRAAETNKELFMGSIRMLANAIDEKDVYTRGHSERVAHYSRVIAQHMGLSDDEVERVYISGILHDVGKIGIEDRILRKPAALTDDEFELMKEHPRKGEHILSAVPRLKEIAAAGLMHHENMDGSGYPDGLKGEEIPLPGRIISVADAFDAMTTDRPYSKAMTHEAAVARLRQLCGKKFDLACVEAMDRAVAAGDLSTTKARLAAVTARRAS